ncbi:MAG: hypothetical protein KAR83_03245 [Thermodesulfovibrionales bacterium]|nr:hypothetical protein [Thermodesulfovibrionales bacterium]
MKHISYINAFLILALLVLLALIVTSSISLAATNSSLWTGTFSSMEKNPDSGDITGCEVRVVVSGKGYSGTFQCAEGWPGKLFMLTDVRFDADQVFFTVPEGLQAGSFRGRMTAEALTGVLEIADYKFVRLHLPRKSSFWD